MYNLIYEKSRSNEICLGIGAFVYIRFTKLKKVDGFLNEVNLITLGTFSINKFF